MVKKVKQYIQQQNMFQVGDRIVLGVSGGADSVALFMLLSELMQEMSLQLFVVHIHHGIRQEADEDAEYVKQLCEKKGVPFYLYRADIPAMAKEKHMSEEEMGRSYRYECFADVMEKVDSHKLVVAHHKNDQVETMLFHMVRGTDVAGMTGMSSVADFNLEHCKGKGYQILRPLLCVDKQELIEWLEKQQITWKEDVTNQDNDYTRNKLRNQVIPILETINEKAIWHIADCGASLSDYQRFVNSFVEDYIKQHVTEEESSDGIGTKKHVVLNRQHLLQQDGLIVRTVLYHLICQVAGRKKDITKEHVKNVAELLMTQSGKQIKLPYDVYASVSYENLIIGQCLENDVNEECYIVDLGKQEEQSVFLLSGDVVVFRKYDMNALSQEEREQFLDRIVNSKNDYTKYFDCDTIKDTLCVRNPMQEDYFLMNEEGKRKAVSRYFIDTKLPLAQRAKQILVAQGHEVLWIITKRRCEQYKVNERTNLVLEITYKGEHYE